MSIQLKAGATTENPKLDRIIQFDERSRQFPILREIKKTVPKPKNRSYTWACSLTLDQGQEGACVGFGISHELAARPAQVQDIDYKFAREKIYWEAQRVDPWEGGSYPHATPRYEGTSVLAGTKVAQKLGYFESYHWSFSLDEMRLGVAYNGPAVIGINIYDNMFDPKPDGFLNVSGDVAGGHCILVRGVNEKGKFFTLRNSWGADWGKGGDCYVTFDDMDRLIHDEGECVFFAHRKTKPTPA